MRKTWSYIVPLDRLCPILPDVGRSPVRRNYVDAKLEDLATSNATVPGIPQNDLTACRVNGSEPDNGPFCSPIHDQNLWTGYTYGGK